MYRLDLLPVPLFEVSSDAGSIFGVISSAPLSIVSISRLPFIRRVLLGIVIRERVKKKKRLFNIEERIDGADKIKRWCDRGGGRGIYTKGSARVMRFAGLAIRHPYPDRMSK